METAENVTPIDTKTERLTNEELLELRNLALREENAVLMQRQIILERAEAYRLLGERYGKDLHSFDLQTGVITRKPKPEQGVA